MTLLQDPRILGVVELLTPQEVATRLRVSVSSVLRYARTGVLNSVRVGGMVRFRASEVDELISGETHDPRQAA